MSLRSPAAVLFDLDGTLVNSEPLNVEAVVLAVRHFGGELDAEDRQFIIGHAWSEIHARFCQRHGLTVSRAELIAATLQERRGLLRTRAMPVLPGAVELVRRLAGRAPLAVVTGSSRAEAHDAIESLGLLDAFAFVLAAEDYARGKPDPEPYRSAIERLAVAPGATLVLEDATPGIRSARGAGARVIGVRAGNYSGYDLSAAHRVVDSLLDVTDDLIADVLG